MKRLGRGSEECRGLYAEYRRLEILVKGTGNGLHGELLLYQCNPL